MATNKNPSATVITQPFILSYPTLLNPEPYKENGVAKGDPIYSFEAISELDDLKSWDILDRDKDEFRKGGVEARLEALAKEKWGDDFDVRGAIKHGGLAWPFKSGDKKAEKAGEKGKHYRDKRFFRAKALASIGGTPFSPALYVSDENGQLTKVVRSSEAGKQLIVDKFYGGAICTAELNAVAGMSGDNKYVTFYINSVVFENDGDRLGGGSHIERMRGVSGGETPYDPTGGMKDDEEIDNEEIPY